MKYVRSTAALGLAIAAVCATPAHAQIQLYGAIDLAVGQLEAQPPGAPNAPIVRVRGVHQGILQNSFIGFRGSEDLGDGLVAKFVLESFLRPDTGQNGRFDATPATGADPFFSREAHVALAGSFGEVRLGNNTNPAWVAMVQTSAMGTSSLFSPSFRQLYNGGTRGRSEVDSALVNSVRYIAPRLNGFDASLALQAGEGSGAGYNHAATVGWRGGPVFVTVAHTQVRHAATPTLPGSRDQMSWLLGGTVDLGLVKLFAQHVDIRNERLNLTDRVTQLGATAPLFDVGQFQFSVGQDVTRAATSSRRTTASIGYVHSLSKRTDLYAMAMQDEVLVGKAQSYVTGIRHRF